MLGEGVLKPVCMTATLPQRLVMLPPILSLGLLMLCFYIFILKKNEREAQVPNKEDRLLFHIFGHCFHLVLSVVMPLQQLPDFSREGSDLQYAIALSTSHPVS